MAKQKINGKLLPSDQWYVDNQKVGVDITDEYIGYFLRVYYNHELANRTIFSEQRVEINPDGTFEFSVPPSDELTTKEITIEVKAPDGAIIKIRRGNVTVFRPNDDDNKYEFENVDPLFSTQVSSPSFIPKSLKIKGRVIDISGTTKVNNLQVILWGTESEKEDLSFDTNTFKPIYVGKTDKDGYFFGTYVPKKYTYIFGVVANSIEESIPIEVDKSKEDYFILKSPIILALNFNELNIETEDCSCEDAVPMLPDSSALVDSPNSFSQDLGGGCVSFTTPNRTIEEFTFYQAVRTTEPAIKGVSLNLKEVRLIRKELIEINSGFKLKIEKIYRSFSNVEIREIEAAENEEGNTTGPGGATPSGDLGKTSDGQDANSAANIPVPGSFSLKSRMPPMVTDSVTGVMGKPNTEMMQAVAVVSANPRMVKIQIEILKKEIEAAIEDVKVTQVNIEKFENSLSTNLTLEEIDNYRGLFNELKKSIITFSQLIDDFKGLHDNFGDSLLMSDPYLVTNYTSLKSTFQDYLNKIKVRIGELERVYINNHTGRSHVSVDNPIDWDDEPTVYQNTTVAHGHLLTIKQQWKAAGYSMGDLLYSLPLAPGQKKQIAVFDWDRDESASRSEIQTNEERLTAQLNRDRDISEIMKSSFAERVSGRSEYKGKSKTFSAGLSASIPAGGALIGVSGGFAGNNTSAASSASQSSSRNLSANSLNQLRDNVQQSATSLRSQRSTVIQTVNQGESFNATTEVIANYNHCHALSLMFFNVLRHFVVEQNLVEVSECLFVPLEMSMFNMDKTLRWKNNLRDFLLDDSLLGAFDALERIKEEYKHSNLRNVSGAYAEETIEDFFGELRISFEIPRPTDPNKDSESFEEDIKAAWLPWKPFMRHWNDSVNLFNKYFLNRIIAQRDKIFEEQVVPTLVEEFVKQLQLKAIFADNSSIDLSLDVTLISKYKKGVPLYVSLRATNNSYGIIKRSAIKQILIHSPADIPQSSKIILHSGSLRYRTPHLNQYLFNTNNIKNDLIHKDAATIYTPLNSRELVNPKNEDYQLGNHLIEHLNEYLEYYHRQLWQFMDKGRLFNLLDGFIAPNSLGKSLSSVVENNIIGVIGNNIVLKVAAGYNLDPTFKLSEGFDLLSHYKPLTPPDPFRISVPTRGVYSEAVMGQCNSCEHIDESRFWRWSEVPTGDEPTVIQPINTDSRRADPGDLQTKGMESPVVNIQNAPSAPDPTGLGAALQLMGTAGIFKDVTGLSGTQANALAQLAQATAASKTSQDAASHALDVAANLEKQKRAQQSSHTMRNNIREDFKNDPELQKKYLEKMYDQQLGGDSTSEKKGILDNDAMKNKILNSENLTYSGEEGTISVEGAKRDLKAEAKELMAKLKELPMDERIETLLEKLKEVEDIEGFLDTLNLFK